MKLLVDSGECATIEEAISTFAGYGIRLVLADGVADSPGQQIIALTAINTAARSFQGNVHITAPPNLVLTAPGFEGMPLSEFALQVGVNPHCVPAEAWPEIWVGESHGCPSKGALTPWASGWAFGVGPMTTVLNPSDLAVFAPACVAAGALAVSEAFSMLRRDNPYAGRRALSFSLWSMNPGVDQPAKGTVTPLDSGLWLVGLGHLGQAYCWTLGLMADLVQGPIVLQDVDTVTASTITTSVLSTPADIKRKKTRIVSGWMEDHGFDTRLVERRFDAAMRVAPGEPTTALFGVDNPAARRACEGAGFSLVLDAGLGSGYKDFRSMRVRAFPGASAADKIWAGEEHVSGPMAPAYEALLAEGKDPCGVTTLATRAVGAPFVGCYAAALLVSELFRRRSGQRGNSVIDASLRNPALVERA